MRRKKPLRAGEVSANRGVKLAVVRDKVNCIFHSLNYDVNIDLAIYKVTSKHYSTLLSEKIYPFHIQIVFANIVNREYDFMIRRVPRRLSILGK